MIFNRKRKKLSVETSFLYRIPDCICYKCGKFLEVQHPIAFTQNFDLINLCDSCYEEIKKTYYERVELKEQMKFTVNEAVNLAHEKFKLGNRFTLPDIYDDWDSHDFGKGGKGMFGINFNRYVENTDCGIKHIGTAENGDALYQLI